MPASVAGTTGPAPREKITPEEYKAMAQGVTAQFGTWSVNEAENTLSLHAEDGLIPRPEGGRRENRFTIVSVTADELKTSGPVGNAVWRRFK